MSSGLTEVKAPRLTGFDRLGDWLDQAAAAVSPLWGARRMAARFATATAKRFLARAGGYHGAQHDRLKSAWAPGGGSADADLLPDLADLRERSRDLNRNDPHAAAITMTMAVNIVGTGITPQCRLAAEKLGITEASANEYENEAEDAFALWCPHADAQNRQDFYQMQWMVLSQILMNGEVFALPLMVKEAGRPFSFAWEIIEADRVETPPHLAAQSNIRDGVELGDRGEPVAYYIRKRHPGDRLLPSGAVPIARDEWLRYPARNRVGRLNVHHLYWVKRPGQTRGEPFFAPVLSYFKHLGDIVEAEIVAERIAACFAVFIKKGANPLGAAIAAAGSTNTQGQRLETIEPGIIERLAEGEEAQFANPNRPGITFEPFILLVLRAISAALGLPYQVILKDFSRMNYSSARAALLDARQFFRVYQDWMAKSFCQPTWNYVIEEAWLRDMIPPVNLVSDRSRAYYLKAEWVPPGWGWVDPVKEVESSKIAIGSALSTMAHECAGQGRDWQAVIRQRKREQEFCKTMGVAPDFGVKAAPGAPADTAAADSPADQPAQGAYA